MSIEEEINEAVKKFMFNKRLPEFIDRAKYLEKKLKKGEYLLVKEGKSEHSGGQRVPDIVDFIYLKLYRPREIVDALSLDCLGDLSWNKNLFKYYMFSRKHKR